jgi:hypothetical protein
MSALLRIASLLCTALLLASFAMFASDQAGSGSKETVAKIANADSSVPARRQAANVDRVAPAPAAERLRERAHGALREAIDDADDVLAGPFASVAGGSMWAQRIVATLLALLVFGAGLGFLSRYAASRGA